MKKKIIKKEYSKEQTVQKVKEPSAVYKTAKQESSMKYLTIGIPDKQYASVLKLVKTLPDVTISEEEDFTIPEWQKEIVSQRMLEHEKNPKSGKSLDTVMKAISKKYGFKYRH